MLGSLKLFRLYKDGKNFKCYDKLILITFKHTPNTPPEMEASFSSGRLLPEALIRIKEAQSNIKKYVITIL